MSSIKSSYRCETFPSDIGFFSDFIQSKVTGWKERDRPGKAEEKKNIMYALPTFF